MMHASLIAVHNDRPACDGGGDDLPLLSWDEVRAHSTRDSCWVVLDGDVLDLTDWLADHPGGGNILLAHAGGDASGVFRQLRHSAAAEGLARAMAVGKIKIGQLAAQARL